MKRLQVAKKMSTKLSQRQLGQVRGLIRSGKPKREVNAALRTGFGGKLSHQWQRKRAFVTESSRIASSKAIRSSMGRKMKVIGTKAHNSPCDICRGKLEGKPQGFKSYSIKANETTAPPFHPNCKCSLH